MTSTKGLNLSKTDFQKILLFLKINIPEFFRFLFKLTQILFEGSYKTTLIIYNEAGRFFSKVHKSIYLFIFIQTGIFISAFLPWVTFSINLLGMETLMIGSQLKLYFLLPGFLGSVLVLTDIPYRRLVYLVFLSIAALLYSAGFAFPDWIHTDIRNMSDYQFTTYYYLYAPFLISGFLILLIQSPFSHPIIPIMDWAYALFKEEPVKKSTRHGKKRVSAAD
jgi:hypothetical protein